jgi:threonine/homoserine/homoserine lactone efflux protein
MPDAHSLATFIVAGLLLNLAPGPDVLYIVGRSLSQGRMAGVVSSFGIATGCLCHVTAAAVGLSALVLALPMAYDVVRYAGAAYLLWLGIRTIVARGRGFASTSLAPASLGTIFRQGVLTNVLNPKVALFFLAFLPQFTNAARGALAPQILLLGFIFIFNGTIVCIGYALAASQIGAWLASRFRISAWLNRATGGIFLALGLRLAFLRRG